MDRKHAAISILVLVCHVTGSDGEAAADPVAHLTSVTDQLTSQFNNLTTKVTHLENLLTVKSAVITNLTRELRAREHELDTLNNYCRNNVDALRGRVGTLENPVSFMVRFDNDTVTDSLRHRVDAHYYRLLFDHVQFQNGGANYNASTGYFTAPSPGTYVFFLTLQRRDQYVNSCVQGNILKNVGGTIAVATACPDGYSSASNMAIVHLIQGDRVWVRTADSNYMFGFVHTTFSGFKLTPH